MGEVYRCRDSNLNREVALKILPAGFAADAERMLRFKREAQLLASLNHPNIGAIYGFEHSGNSQALVLELIEGPTLADRIARSPIPADEAIPIARQIAEAMEAAHELGVVHRDLKPDNIKLRADGVVKVLDFGLAKASQPSEGAIGSLALQTLTSPMATGMGVILGTPAYMSPEQARGQAVDRRADIWAFGTVLYEMLTGRRLFCGENIAETVASVLRQEIDWSALPTSTPTEVKSLLVRCLNRDVKRRLRDVGEARIILESPQVPPADPEVVLPQKARWRSAVAMAMATVAAGTLAAIGAWNLKPLPKSEVTRFSFTLPDGQEPVAPPGGHVLAVSPDGTQIVYAAMPNARLYLRSLAKGETTPIQGTEGYHRATDPVFSPDGQSIAFYAQSDRTIKRIPVSGGTAFTICKATNPLGMSWNEEGFVFGQENSISRVSPNGGAPETLVRLKEGEIAHAPQLLPGGKYVLLTVASINEAARWDKAQIVAQSLSSGERTTLLKGGSEARYLNTGHLVYAVGVRLFAIRFSPQTLQVSGSPVAVMDEVRRADDTGAAHYAISSNGSLVYVPASASIWADVQPAIVDREGRVQGLNLPAGHYLGLRASPDGTHIAYGTDDGTEATIWTYDIGGATAVRKFTSGSNNRFPAWSSDGKRLTFQSDREGDLALYWQSADGTGSAQRLTKAEPGTSHVPDAWSPNGETLLYSVIKGSKFSLWAYSWKEKSSHPFGEVSSEVPGNPVFSPDGRWVAYTSGLKDSTTVFVQPFPPSGAKFQLVREQSENPHEVLWSRDGRELFYNPRPSGFEVVPVTTKPTFEFGQPTALKRPFQLAAPTAHRSYDMMPNGKFLALMREGYGAPAEIRVVLNWFEELTTQVPVR